MSYHVSVSMMFVSITNSTSERLVVTGGKRWWRIVKDYTYATGDIIKIICWTYIHLDPVLGACNHRFREFYLKRLLSSLKPSGKGRGSNVCAILKRGRLLDTTIILWNRNIQLTTSMEKIGSSV
ncbi:MAG: hypothetical protein ACJATS_000093 [Psychroserpens sp.]